MSAESIALIPKCAECGRPWLPADSERWSALRADEEGEEPELCFFCPRCAEREFRDD